MAEAPLVIDTNVVLDLFVYDDPAAQPLRQWLDGRSGCWHATGAMREELARVLGYPHIARRMAQRPISMAEVLAQFDRHATLVPPAPKASYTCKDPDDQKFIDLAVALGACLLSKDAAVLCMARRLERVGVQVRRQWCPQGGAATLAA